MYLLGIDIGTSFIKVSVVNADDQSIIAAIQYPETEREIISLKQDWAEQNPEQWWEDVKMAIKKANALKLYNTADIKAIGITYQMHGLVLLDNNKNTLRNAIIWCDSRAVNVGEEAFKKIGKEKCLIHLLNSPGNFTAAKLAWLKQNEPALFEKVHTVMLPGDFINFKLTGEINTSIAALSEGIFWDFKNNELSKDVFDYFGFDTNFIPSVQPIFEEHGFLQKNVADEIGLTKGIAVTYKVGDQPNNALSLNVFNAGEVAATAGTSGVIYAVDDKLQYDIKSRVNSFAHVNYSSSQKNTGVLLCINGAGHANSFIRKKLAADKSYNYMNELAATVPQGADGLMILPFGNGAERILGNKIVAPAWINYNSIIHSNAHIFRAVQEGVAFAFRYGLDIMQENKIVPTVIRAGQANMFLSDVFTDAFVNSTGVPVELYNTNGSVGAALGAAMGKRIYTSAVEMFQSFKPVKTIYPSATKIYEEKFQQWNEALTQLLNNTK